MRETSLEYSLGLRSSILKSPGKECTSVTFMAEAFCEELVRPAVIASVSIFIGKFEVRSTW